MTDDDTDPTADEPADEAIDALAVTSDYKVLGELNSPGGIGVLGHNTATTGVGSGVRGETRSAEDDSSGVFGVASPGTGQIYGVRGRTDSGSFESAGVFGNASSGDGRVFGVHGISNSSDTFAAGIFGEGVLTGIKGRAFDDFGTGVLGEAFASSGPGTGVTGTCDSPTGTGVKGRANADTGETTGVLGRVESPTGTGVEGRSTKDSGVNYGVLGTNSSPDGYAVYGETFATSGYAVFSEGRLRVRGDVAQSGGGNLDRHIAGIQNTSSSSNPIPDVLGLELPNVTDPGEFHSYISFMDSTGTIGNIQGDGNGGVEFVGSLADFAEFFPKRDPDRTFEGGEVVGLADGEVVASHAGADLALVVSSRPFLTGNRPAGDDDAAHVKLSLVGQVPVRVSGPVESGDVLVASPDDDGTAVACRFTDAGEARPVVGQALAGHDLADGDEAEVPALVGGPVPDGTTSDGGHGRQSEPAEDLRREVAELREKNDRLRERLAAVERRLVAVEETGGD